MGISSDAALLSNLMVVVADVHDVIHYGYPTTTVSWPTHHLVVISQVMKFSLMTVSWWLCVKRVSHVSIIEHTGKYFISIQLTTAALCCRALPWLVLGLRFD
jgi:hypothetical protein